MRDPWDIDLEADGDADARAIVAAARRRALGTHHHWRRLSAVLWASFLGAAAALVFVLLLPAEGWFPLDTKTRTALAFAALWLLALIPALIAAALAAPESGEHDHGAR